jgi:hypothetical protein
VFDFVCFAVEGCEAVLAFVAAAELAFEPDAADFAGFFAVAVFVLPTFDAGVLLEASCAKTLLDKQRQTKQRQTAVEAQTAPNHPVAIFPRCFGSNE